MQDYSLGIYDFLSKSDKLKMIDVRSPSEYEHAHIPGAVNMPLLNNEERSVIGTLYLQKGSSAATIKGLEFIGPKIKDFAEEGQKLVPGGEALLYCWRGGMRSNSMAWLFNSIGIKASTLTGGYKTYRRFVQSSFEKPVNLVVIGGMTGSGKTAVIEALENMGRQVIHLERIANHKGSVFGAIGLTDQPSAEQFENEIFMALSKLNPEEPVFVEDESLAIGKVFIPRAFYDQMSSARFINLFVPLENRINMLVENYGSGDPGLLAEGIRRIEKRLGFENARKAVNLILNGKMPDAVQIVLKYYDKIYARSMSLHQRKDKHEIMVDHFIAGDIAGKVLEYLKS